MLFKVYVFYENNGNMQSFDALRFLYVLYLCNYVCNSAFCSEIWK